MVTMESRTHKEAHGLSFFERYLTVWVGVCILGDIVLGKPAPGLARKLGRRGACHGSRRTDQGAGDVDAGAYLP